MITEEVYRGLKYGDEIYVSLTEKHDHREYKFQINEWEFQKGTCIWLPCVGVHQERLQNGESMITAVIITNPEIYGWNWTGSRHIAKVQAPNESELNRIISTRGWWISRSGIQEVRSGSSASKETPPLPCVECKQFYPMAIPNFVQNKLVCWGCRDSLGWKYGMKDGNVFLKG